MVLLWVLMLIVGAVSARRFDDVDRELQTFDFAWDLTPQPNFPLIAFDAENLNSEIVFRFDYGGSLSSRKFLQPTLFLFDCESAGTENALVTETSTDNDEFTVTIDVVQANIDPSLYYTPSENGLTAQIEFCLRVDYMYQATSEGPARSINFHQTKVILQVALTAGFELEAISTDVERNEDELSTFVQYAVDAFFCLEDNTEIPTPTYYKGDKMRFCVKIADELADQELYVYDIKTAIISQLGDPNLAGENTIVIQNTRPSDLSTKVCGTPDGICNILTQLFGAYFDDPEPADLQVDGIAIVRFGSPQSAEGSRLLRVNFRGSLSKSEPAHARALQLSPEDDYMLQVPLAVFPSEAPSSAPLIVPDDGEPGGLSIRTDDDTFGDIDGALGCAQERDTKTIALLLTSLLLADALLLCCLWGAYAARRRRQIDESTKSVEKHVQVTTNVVVNKSKKKEDMKKIEDEECIDDDVSSVSSLEMEGATVLYKRSHSDPDLFGRTSRRRRPNSPPSKVMCKSLKPRPHSFRSLDMVGTMPTSSGSSTDELPPSRASSKRTVSKMPSKSSTISTKAHSRLRVNASVGNSRDHSKILRSSRNARSFRHSDDDRY